ncbi:MAG: hypothetical protein ACRDQ0_01515, partial [Pseudonocardia sp.]
MTTRKALPWLLVAVAAGALVGVSPIVAAAGVGGVLLVGLAVAAPHATVGLTVLGVLFVRPLEHLVPIPLLGYLDEAMVLLCALVLPLRRVVAGQALRAFPGQWWFVGFAVAGLLSGVAMGVDPATYLAGASVICKGLVFAWAVAQLDWEERHLHTAARAGAVLVAACLVA